MWFRNRLVNPVVRLLLRSPLHPVLSRSLMILSYQGRKTGRWRSLPCMYARDGQDLYVVSGQPDRKVWWRNMHQPTRVRLHLQGRDLEGIATASSDPEAVAAGLRPLSGPLPQDGQAPRGPAGRHRHPPRHDHDRPPAGRGQHPPGSPLAPAHAAARTRPGKGPVR
jgi:F420H(2)-dependent quinone reductase